MDYLWLYVLVFVLSAIPFFEAIAITPVAIFAGLSAVPVFLLAVVGNLLTIYPIIFFFEKIKAWRKKQGEESRRRARARALWNRYGMPGLALIGPFFIGSHLSAFLGLLFGGTRANVSLWMTVSIVGWCLLLGMLASLGVDWLNLENKLVEQIFTR